MKRVYIHIMQGSLDKGKVTCCSKLSTQADMLFLEIIYTCVLYRYYAQADLLFLEINTCVLYRYYAQADLYTDSTVYRLRYYVNFILFINNFYCIILSVVSSIKLLILLYLLLYLCQNLAYVKTLNICIQMDFNDLIVKVFKILFSCVK